MTVLGVWMWSSSIRKRGAEAVMDSCAAAGVTDVFFLVKGLLGTAAYTSCVVPTERGRDLLREALEAAHARNIRLHAWYTTACDRQYVTAHPESGRFHCRRGADDQMVSLTDEGYQVYMEQAVREICQRYPLDGIHLDYIRYNHITSGWSETDRKRYEAEGVDTGRVLALLDRMYYQTEEKNENLLFEAYCAGDRDVLGLAMVRRKMVVRFAARLREVIKSENSHLSVTAALMPEGAYDDPSFADLHYGQNYADAVGLYDYVLPMAYTKSYGKDSLWLRKLAENSSAVGLKTVMGLQAFPEAAGLSLHDDTAVLRNTGADGICLFREGSYVTAYCTGREVVLYNGTDERITGLTAVCGEETVSLQTDLETGEKNRVVLPWEADVLRAFSGTRESCVFTVKR